MKLPDMPYKDKIKKTQQTKFGGLNQNVGAGDGEICDMLNMVSNDYPVLSSRPPRYTKNITANNGLIYIADEAYYVNGTTLYHDGTAIGTLTDSKKKFAVMPYYLIIFPDKKAVRLGVKGYYATLAALGTALEAAFTTPSANDRYGVGTNPYTIYYWDISTSPAQWTKLGNEVEPMESTWSGALSFLAEGKYAGVSAQNNTIYNASVDWSDYFRVGDAVTIDGCTKHTENNMTPIIREIDGNNLRFYENIFVTENNFSLTVDESYKYKISGTTVHLRLLFITDLSYDESVSIAVEDPTSLYIPVDTKEEFYYFKVGTKITVINKINNIINSVATLVKIEYENSVDYFIDDNSEWMHIKNIQADGKTQYTLDDTKAYCLFSGISDSSPNYGQFIISDLSELIGKIGVFIKGETISGSFVSTDNETYQLGDVLPEKIKMNTLEPIDYEESSVILKRTVPDMDFIFCNDNRLWGCKNDTINASKLGDPFNFNVFDGVSTDSYATESGTHGDFTGVISYISYPIFFKEDHILKIYGTKPSDFQIYDTASNGVKAGSEQSLAVAGETLYYQSKAGIMAYTGGTPTLVSVALGNTIYKNGIAGSDGSKYFIDLINGTTHYLFVYDPLRQMWHKEAPLGNAFIYFADELWSYDGETLTALSALSAPTGATKEDEVEWSVEFADFTVESPNRKGISRFYLRCEVTGTMDVYIQCDGGEWVKRFSCENQSKRSLSIPIIPQRADHYRIKLSGKGEVKVYSLTTDYYVGSEN